MIVEWTPHAEAALLHASQYIAERHPRAAIKFMREVIEKTSNLTQFPALGRSGFYPDTRELLVHRNYLVVYRVRDERVEILQFWHTAQRRESGSS
jgi:addiction module RelE/StbE family toxin